jgi:hypothetical protein
MKDRVATISPKSDDFSFSQYQPDIYSLLWQPSKPVGGGDILENTLYAPWKNS